MKQNGLFEEFFHSNVLVKYYRIQWLLEEKNISEKAPIVGSWGEFIKKSMPITELHTAPAPSRFAAFFLLVTILSRSTFLIHYYTKILQNGNFFWQISPQERYFSYPYQILPKMLFEANFGRKVISCA